MEWIIWIAVMFMVGTTVVNVRTKSQITRAIDGKPTVELNKMLEEPKLPTHRLVRTWIVSSRENAIPAGWRWKCSCSVWGVADNASITNGKYDLGTEEVAIAGFTGHAKRYQEANRNIYKEKFEQASAEFAEYRRLCYCKDANDALAPWKDI